MTYYGCELGSRRGGLELGVSVAQTHLTACVALHVVQSEYVVLFVMATRTSVAQNSLPNVSSDWFASRLKHQANISPGKGCNVLPTSVFRGREDLSAEISA